MKYTLALLAFLKVTLSCSVLPPNSTSQDEKPKKLAGIVYVGKQPDAKPWPDVTVTIIALKVADKTDGNGLFCLATSHAKILLKLEWNGVIQHHVKVDMDTDPKKLRIDIEEGRAKATLEDIGRLEKQLKGMLSGVEDRELLEAALKDLTDYKKSQRLEKLPYDD